MTKLSYRLSKLCTTKGIGGGLAKTKLIYPWLFYFDFQTHCIQCNDMIKLPPDETGS